jgi:hypothetical protein
MFEVIGYKTKADGETIKVELEQTLSLKYAEAMAIKWQGITNPKTWVIKIEQVN